MNNIVSCTLNRYEETCNLIKDTFNNKYNDQINILKKIAIAIDINNIKNMNILLKNGEIIAHIAFYPTLIYLKNTHISVAEISGVVTKNSFRNRGYATELLKFVERKIKNKNISLALISGRYSIYTKQKYFSVGKCYEFFLDKTNSKSIKINFENTDFIELSEDNNNYIFEMFKIYNNSDVKFKRTLVEFKKMLKSSTSDFKVDVKHKIILIKNNEKIVSYIILRIYEEERITADIVECCGNYKYIFYFIPYILEKYELESIRYRNTFNNEFVKLLKNNNILYKEIKFPGLIKILNFKQFMKELKHYFIISLSKEIVNNIKFYECDNNYIFRYKTEEILIKDKYTLTNLVFTGIDISKNDNIVKYNIKDLDKFIEKIFPIPFVWYYNLNYC